MLHNNTHLAVPHLWRSLIIYESSTIRDYNGYIWVAMCYHNGYIWAAMCYNRLVITRIVHQVNGSGKIITQIITLVCNKLHL